MRTLERRHNCNNNQNHNSKDKSTKDTKDADSKPTGFWCKHGKPDTNITVLWSASPALRNITAKNRHNILIQYKKRMFILILLSISIFIIYVHHLYVYIFDIYNFTRSSPFPSTAFRISPPCHVSGLHGPCGVVHGRVHGLAGDLAVFRCFRWNSKISRSFSKLLMQILNDVILYHLVSCPMSATQKKTKAS